MSRITTGNRHMDNLMAILPPSNEKAVYLPYVAILKRRFETSHYARTFGTDALTESELEEFLRPIEEIVKKYLDGAFIPPQWIFLFLCFAIFPLIILGIIHCCKKIGNTYPTFYETTTRIQDYLREKEPWLQRRGLSCTFQTNFDFMMLVISRGAPVHVNMALYSRYGQAGMPVVATQPVYNQAANNVPVYGQNNQPGVIVQGTNNADLMTMQRNNMDNYA